MGSLLKDILLRHQKWEEEEGKMGSLLELKAGSGAAQGRGDDSKHMASESSKQQLPQDSVTPPISSESATSPLPLHTSYDSVSTAQSPPPLATAPSRKRYRTRPPGLRPTEVARIAASASHDDGQSAPAPSTRCNSSSTVLRQQPVSPLVEASVRQNTTTPAPTSTTAAGPPPPPSLRRTATLALPLTPYPVQQEMAETITEVLRSSTPHVVPVAVTEVPTGCGKTMALLSTVLRYQQELKRMTAREADAHLSARRPPWLQRRPPPPQRTGGGKARGKGATASKEQEQLRRSAGGGTGIGAHSDSDSEDSEGGDGSPTSSSRSPWTVPQSFFRHFRVTSQRKIRAEMDMTGSAELRRQYSPPPCTIYYVTRTHAQLRQAVRELRRLHGAPSAIRMNVLGSRERYCIHPKVLEAKGNHTLPVEGNNLGEVCDKLVSVGMCEMAEKYDELSCSAMSGPIGGQRGMIWDVEDLVLEGATHSQCPYYAARDLVFFADINFCTYPYLLDPLIRHETKMEAALKNNAIIVFDEAHNVPAVCQDALSLECLRSVIDVILAELEPLMANRHTLARQPPSGVAATAVAAAVGAAGADSGFATMQYPRELYLGAYTLVEIFAFLFSLFQSIAAFVDSLADDSTSSASTAAAAGSAAKRRRDDEAAGEGEACTPGTALEHRLRSDMEGFVRKLNETRASGETGSRKSKGLPPSTAALDLFQRAYGVIMSLGVTFNPFLFSIFGLSMLKRWLLLLRFLFQKPSCFALTMRRAEAAEDTVPPVQPLAHTLGAASGIAGLVAASGPGGSRAPSTALVEVRCLDGSLAFQHLLQSVHRVVLASGTLSPFPQLAKDLGMAAAQWRTVEGLHVVPSTQYRLCALTSLPHPSAHSTHSPSEGTLPLRCTYASLSNPVFLRAVARCVVRLARTVQRTSGGGVLLFVPNYALLHTLAKMTREALLVVAREDPLSTPSSRPLQLFVEPRKAEALTEVLHQFQSCTQAPQCGTALLLSVYRGKVSEGIDFTDEMARLVMCLGVPLQPLKSWKVIAQRAYSGPEWYTTDAVRAVNQALGRCLRHVRDFGAVVLLDERYAQADYQQRLSRWCRTALQSYAFLPTLCESLEAAFAQWHGELGEARTAVAGGVSAGTAQSSTPSSCLLSKPVALRSGFEVNSQCTESQPLADETAKGRLGTDQLPFRRVHRAALKGAVVKPLADVREREKAEGRSVTTVRRASSPCPDSSEGLLHSPFACTAVKLLYESAKSTREVSRQDLQAAIALLADTFADDSPDDDLAF